MELIILLVVVVVIAAFVIGVYNGLIGRRNRIDEALAQIQVQLKRRHDLIPNLVNAVKGYMNFEQKVLTDVTNARASAVAAGAQGSVAQQANAENYVDLFMTYEECDNDAENRDRNNVCPPIRYYFY